MSMGIPLVSEAKTIAETGWPRSARARIMIVFALVLVTLAIYYPVKQNDFISLDDPYYVSENAQVQQGLTRSSVIWAFTSTKVAAYWHPVTWLSHMADCQFFGVNPGAHHLSSLAIHLLNVVLLFLLIHRMTAALWRSAFVAGLFALHPLNVESVAWIAERKNVLSTLLCLLAIWAYVTYTRQPTMRNYLQVCVTFALGLMAKPMLVTLPFLLLLLDFWPLRRITPTMTDRKAQALWLLREKMPLLALSIASSIVTLKTQAVALPSLQLMPLSVRLSNVLVSYATYLYRFFWPHDLAVFYPYHLVPAWKVTFSATLFLVCTVAAMYNARKRPYFIVGWFWFLGSLVPVIGLVQSGMQANADRFIYIPFIGMFLILGWGLGEIADAAPKIRASIVFLCVATVVAFAAETRHQVGYWRDTITLFTRALEVTKDNAVAQMVLASALDTKGDHQGALFHGLAALQIEPTNGFIYYSVGRIKLEQDKAGEAEYYFREALKYPNSPQSLAKVHDRLAFVLDRKGELREAEAEYQRAIALNPEESYYSRLNFGVLLAKQRRYALAVQQYSELLKEAPDQPSLYFLRGMARQGEGQVAGAADDFRRALELEPSYAPARIKLNSMEKSAKVGEQ